MDAQSRFLRRRAAEKREMETCCDCTGCDTCTGFVRNCTCDHDLSFLAERRKAAEERARSFAKGNDVA